MRNMLREMEAMDRKFAKETGMPYIEYLKKYLSDAVANEIANQGNVHPAFFDKTAEEQAEQDAIAQRKHASFLHLETRDTEPSLVRHLNPTIIESTETTFWDTARQTLIDETLKVVSKLRNYASLNNENKNTLFLLALNRHDVSVKITNQGELLLAVPQDEFPELFTNELCNPIKYNPLKGSVTYKVSHTDNDGWINLNNWMKCHLSDAKDKQLTSSFGMAEQHITDLLKARVMQAIQEKTEKSEKQKNKAAYKDKSYKNTAKKVKPSPILMALINKK